jgi:two-component system chemotaxis response regulator CheB
MPKIRILVVDDAAVVRRMVSEELSKDPALEVVGTAANGKIALARLPQVNPDLVILDIEMPEMDGLETLRELRKTYRRLPVIMFSSRTERGATATLDALAMGATDYFAKPSSGGLEASLEVLRTQLIPEIKAICAPPSSSPLPHDGGEGLVKGAPVRAPTSVAAAAQPTAAVDVLAIGASTGGPNALAEIIPGLPADFPVPIVIVQHMPAVFTKLLAERLSAQSSIKVHEGASGIVVEPGHAYVAPGDYHMVVSRDGVQRRLLIHQDPPENSCRPAVDPLFRSVAAAYGANTLAVILTGMGQDGLRGCQLLREAGAQILVQDEATSVVWGMPGAVARAGVADRILPLSMIASEIVRRARARPSTEKTRYQ